MPGDFTTGSKKNMTINLSSDNFTRERVGYFVVAEAVLHDDTVTQAVITNDPGASGCPPYRWSPSQNNYLGYEFATREAAASWIKSAACAYGSYDLAMVNTDSAKVIAVKFVNTQTAEVIE